jgi:hypothetical protein
MAHSLRQWSATRRLEGALCSQGAAMPHDDAPIVDVDPVCKEDLAVVDGTPDLPALLLDQYDILKKKKRF